MHVVLNENYLEFCYVSIMLVYDFHRCFVYVWFPKQLDENLQQFPFLSSLQLLWRGFCREEFATQGRQVLGRFLGYFDRNLLLHPVRLVYLR